MRPRPPRPRPRVPRAAERPRRQARAVVRQRAAAASACSGEVLRRRGLGGQPLVASTSGRLPTAPPTAEPTAATSASAATALRAAGPDQHSPDSTARPTASSRARQAAADRRVAGERAVARRTRGTSQAADGEQAGTVRDRGGHRARAVPPSVGVRPPGRPPQRPRACRPARRSGPRRTRAGGPMRWRRHRRPSPRPAERRRERRRGRAERSRVVGELGGQRRRARRRAPPPRRAATVKDARGAVRHRSLRRRPGPGGPEATDARSCSAAPCGPSSTAGGRRPHTAPGPSGRRAAGRRIPGVRGCQGALVVSAPASSLGAPPTTTERRLDTTTAPTMISTATSAMSTRTVVLASSPTDSRDDGGRDEQRDQVHHLDQRVDRRAGGVLERVADGVADDGRGVRLAALAAVGAVLDHLLRVVPGAAGVGEEDRHQHAGRDRADQVGRQRADAEAEADRHRRQDRQQAGRGQLAQRVLGADVDDARCSRAARCSP